MHNPYANYGKLVTGSRFIGRKDELTRVFSRLCHASGGNLAIVGESRIGKSSLAHHALVENESRFLGERIIPVWLNLATLINPSDFFVGLVVHSCNTLKRHAMLSSKLVRLKNAVQASMHVSWPELQVNIQAFFEELAGVGIGVIFAIDEFDAAASIFHNHPAHFQEMRELSTQPRWRISWLLISRRPIEDIEKRSNAISNFHGTIKDIRLRGFVEEDAEEFYRRLANNGVPIGAAAVRKSVFARTGNHPFLLDVLAYEIVEDHLAGRALNMARVFERTEQEFFVHYRRVLKAIESDGDLQPLIDIIRNGESERNADKVKSFASFGLLRKTPQGYSCTSDHFQQFLHSCAQ